MESRFDMRREMIDGLIERCRAAQRRGAAPDEIRDRVLPREVERLLGDSSPQDFLEWIKEDRDYSYYYFDAQQSGACAKPREAVALILELIALGALE